MYLLNHRLILVHGAGYADLHSTMYLLNRTARRVALIAFCSFTFHYVSIKSTKVAHHESVYFNLHSTMYLLNRATFALLPMYFIFTFHYVSIKSACSARQLSPFLSFTFHYVSIKSRIATPYHFSSLFSVFLSTYHHTMLNHMYTSPSSFILRITTILSTPLYFCNISGRQFHRHQIKKLVASSLTPQNSLSSHLS